MRFFATCTLLVGLSVGAVALLGQVIWTPPSMAHASKTEPDAKPADVSDKPAQAERERAASSLDDDKPAASFEPHEAVGTPQSVIIHEARLLPVEQQDVPAEHDGKLLFLATDVRPGEVVPPEKQQTYEVSILAVQVNTWDGIDLKDRISDSRNPKQLYRRVRPTDELAPGKTTIIVQTLHFRKLDVGDRVHAGQLLGIINPDLALAELAIKQSKVEGAEAERLTSLAMWEESKRRLALLDNLRSKGARMVTEEDYGIARVTVTRYFQEEISKRAAGQQASRELSAALTTLNQHLIRASIDGVIKGVYKRRGEAVKNLDTVLQIQNPARLSVETQVDVQDALPLRDRWSRALKERDLASQMRAEAMAKGQTDSVEARKLEQDADRLVRVYVEASKVEPPSAVLAGHLQEVNCVAVTSDKEPKIVSGSEDQTVRVWARQAGTDRWQEQLRLNHYATVRAVACTARTSKSNLLLTATATGRGRLFDLNDLKAGERFLQGRHSGPINAVAFSPDGTLCATGGEDRAICLWETAEGKQLAKISGAHRLGVTSLMFTAKGQLVSAGKDKRLVVWNVADSGEEGKTLTQADTIPRSGDVAQLGADPTGEKVLYEEGRELRVLRLNTRKIEGVLQTGSPTSTFATMALYSPDGHTILTNGNAVGRLQLWRAPTDKARSAELRQYVWSNGAITCGAFSPDGKVAVTGTQDNRVLVWQMPEKAEAEKAIEGQLSYVEGFLDTSLKRLTVRAVLDNPGWIIPGSSAAIVVPPLR